MQEKGFEEKDLALLLQYFPEVTLPVTITGVSVDAFMRENKPLPQLLSAVTIELWEEEPADDVTEYQPGFSFKLGPFRGFLYWKAALLHYAYVLVLVDKKGQLLDRLELAETSSESGFIRQGAAFISEEGHIYAVESALGEQATLGDPSQTITERWMITPQGAIREMSERT